MLEDVLNTHLHPANKNPHGPLHVFVVLSHMHHEPFYVEAILPVSVMWEPEGADSAG